MENETEEVSGSGSDSDSLFCCKLTSENLGLNQRTSVNSSLDSGCASVSSRTSFGGRRSRRNSLESSGTLGGRRWMKKQQLRVTSQQPFKLRTEQRGKLKEEEFMKKMQEMLTEQERLRIPIAQGLPWTTDEPQCLLKPPVKESTKPIDLKLHSDLRAIDRAEFDQQLKEKKPLVVLRKALENAPPVRYFLGALRAANEQTGLPGLIAEVKKASPSRGILREDFDPVRVDMGEPVLKASDVPTKLSPNKDIAVIKSEINVGVAWNVTCVSMGNPHCIDQ